MKRNEVVFLINNAIYEYNHKINGQNFDSLARYILYKIEQAGMEPPAGDIYCTCSHATGEANRWDDE